MARVPGCLGQVWPFTYPLPTAVPKLLALPSKRHLDGHPRRPAGRVDIQRSHQGSSRRASAAAATVPGEPDPHGGHRSARCRRLLRRGNPADINLGPVPDDDDRLDEGVAKAAQPGPELDLPSDQLRRKAARGHRVMSFRSQRLSSSARRSPTFTRRTATGISPWTDMPARATGPRDRDCDCGRGTGGW